MSVIKYYDCIAKDYDFLRFNNTYGSYIDLSERNILNSFLADVDKKQVIDLGCGTGRLLNYALTGVDGSKNMLDIALLKYPHHTLIEANITDKLNYDKSFDYGMCFHVLMHLEKSAIRSFFINISKNINPKGRLIVDVLSAPRRDLLKNKKLGWHANTCFSISDVEELIKDHWKINRWEGIIMLPIHKIPPFIRKILFGIDKILCKSLLARYASYYIIELEKIN
jgi:SAM-dependent methyltransferase